MFLLSQQKSIGEIQSVTDRYETELTSLTDKVKQESVKTANAQLRARANESDKDFNLHRLQEIEASLKAKLQ